MTTKEGQIILNKIIKNPQIVIDLSLNLFLLKFLRLTGHDNLRKMMIENKNLDILIGYIPKILLTSDYKFIHLFKIDNEYYINDNYFDYIVIDNEILRLIDPKLSYLTSEDIYFNSIYKVYNTSDLIIIQEENGDIKDTDEIKKIFNIYPDFKKNMDIKTYDKYFKYNYLNRYKYQLIVIITKNYQVYFKHKDKQYLYYNGTISLENWDHLINSDQIIFSIYNKQSDNFNFFDSSSSIYHSAVSNQSSYYTPNSDNSIYYSAVSNQSDVKFKSPSKEKSKSSVVFYDCNIQ